MTPEEEAHRKANIPTWIEAITYLEIIAPIEYRSPHNEPDTYQWVDFDPDKLLKVKTNLVGRKLYVNIRLNGKL